MVKKIQYFSQFRKTQLYAASFRALSHDQEKYENPEAFHPDRHLDDHGKLLSGDDIYAYGFGRR